MSIESERLLGNWRTDPRDRWSLNEFGDVSLNFDATGSLVYTIHLPDKDQIMRLIYRRVCKSNCVTAVE